MIKALSFVLLGIGAVALIVLAISAYRTPRWSATVDCWGPHGLGNATYFLAVFRVPRFSEVEGVREWVFVDVHMCEAEAYVIKGKAPSVGRLTREEYEEVKRLLAKSALASCRAPWDGSCQLSSLNGRYVVVLLSKVRPGTGPYVCIMARGEYEPTVMQFLRAFNVGAAGALMIALDLVRARRRPSSSGT